VLLVFFFDRQLKRLTTTGKPLLHIQRIDDSRAAFIGDLIIAGNINAKRQSIIALPFTQNMMVNWR
jgi:hypothetical protein